MVWASGIVYSLGILHFHLVSHGRETAASVGVPEQGRLEARLRIDEPDIRLVLVRLDQGRLDAQDLVDGGHYNILCGY